MEKWLVIVSGHWDIWSKIGTIQVDIKGVRYQPVEGSYWFYTEFRRVYRRSQRRALKLLEKWAGGKLIREVVITSGG